MASGIASSRRLRRGRSYRCRRRRHRRYRHTLVASFSSECHCLLCSSVESDMGFKSQQFKKTAVYIRATVVALVSIVS